MLRILKFAPAKVFFLMLRLIAKDFVKNGSNWESLVKVSWGIET